MPEALLHESELRTVLCLFFKVLKRNLHVIGSWSAPARMGVFLLILVVLWLPFAILFYGVWGDRSGSSAVALAILYIEFLGLLQGWGKWVDQQPNLLKVYGLVFNRQALKHLLQGLAMGSLGVFVLFALEGLFGWATWQTPKDRFLLIVMEGLGVGLGVGFAEELFFRGWLLEELRRDYHPRGAGWMSSLVFAALHFIKPLAEIGRTWPQFPGLLLLGLTLVRAKQAGGRDLHWPFLAHQKSKSAFNPLGSLGLPIGLHGGLIWGYYMIKVGQLVDSSGAVPEWITGIDQNPLAGVLGLCCIGAIAIALKKF